MTSLYGNLEKSKLLTRESVSVIGRGLGRGIHCEREQKNVLK